MSDPRVLRLASAELFPPGRLPLHVNHPLHQGSTPLHDHDFIEVALVCAGTGTHRSLPGSVGVRRGAAVVLHPGQWHAWQACRNLRLYNACFTTALLAGELAWALGDACLSRLLPRPGRLQAQGAARLDPTAFARAEQAASRLHSLQNATGAAQRAEQIGQLVVLLAAVGGALDAELQAPRPDPAVERALAALEAEPARAWSLGELAAIAGLAGAVLVRRFHRATGLPPLAWLARKRAERMAVLLATTALSVQKAGAAVGWPDANHAARRFRQFAGASPSAYRAGVQAGAGALPSRGVDGWVQW